MTYSNSKLLFWVTLLLSILCADSSIPFLDDESVCKSSLTQTVHAIGFYTKDDQQYLLLAIGKTIIKELKNAWDSAAGEVSFSPGDLEPFPSSWQERATLAWYGAVAVDHENNDITNHWLYMQQTNGKYARINLHDDGTKVETTQLDFHEKSKLISAAHLGRNLIMNKIDQEITLTDNTYVNDETKKTLAWPTATSKKDQVKFAEMQVVFMVNETVGFVIDNGQRVVHPFERKGKVLELYESKPFKQFFNCKQRWTFVASLVIGFVLLVCIGWLCLSTNSPLAPRRRKEMKPTSHMGSELLTHSEFDDSGKKSSTITGSSGLASSDIHSTYTTSDIEDPSTIKAKSPKKSKKKYNKNASSNISSVASSAISNLSTAVSSIFSSKATSPKASPKKKRSKASSPVATKKSPKTSQGSKVATSKMSPSRVKPSSPVPKNQSPRSKANSSTLKSPSKSPSNKD